MENNKGDLTFKSKMTRDGGAWLSNFWPYVKPNAAAAATELWNVPQTEGGFQEDGHRWTSSEHYYQYHVCVDREYAKEQIKEAVDAVAAKRAASATAYSKWFRSKGLGTLESGKRKWKEMRDRTTIGTRQDIMRRALLHKFDARNNPRLCAALIATGTRKLLEAGDRGGKGSLWNAGKGGGNLLGKLLESEREHLVAGF